MTPGDKVFITVADKSGAMYLPGKTGELALSLPRNGGVAWKVFASGRASLTRRIESSKDLPFYRDARSLMSVPLSAEGEKIGILQIESADANAFSEEDLQKFELIAFVLSHPLHVRLSVEIEEKQEVQSD